ncbi:puromycin-sensitive aminopeptidase-like protein isoform X2 [Tanacetum coccineum]
MGLRNSLTRWSYLQNDFCRNQTCSSFSGGYVFRAQFEDGKVYEKEAEVVRMYKTLLGSEGFHKGTNLYFQRHEGKAITCEDFFAAI